MINIFKKKEETSNNILVECYKDIIYFRGIEILFPIHLNKLIEILGEPTKKEHDLLWRVTWDNLGIYTEYATWDNIHSINFLISDNHKLNHFPSVFFKGKFLLEGLEIQLGDFKKIELDKNELRQLVFNEKIEPYAISVGKNFNYKEVILKDKYLIKDLKEDKIEFQDFGFKLSIIQELMYNKELLKPKFDLHEFVEWYDKRKIDLEKEGYEPIPEITQYFKDLPIPKKLASEITEIYQDGGNDIYMQLIRFGEGWEEYWDIEKTEDAKQFPNLKKAILCYAKENVIEEFNRMEIKAEWI